MSQSCGISLFMKSALTFLPTSSHRSPISQFLTPPPPPPQLVVDPSPEASRASESGRPARLVGPHHGPCDGTERRRGRAHRGHTQNTDVRIRLVLDCTVFLVCSGGVRLQAEVSSGGVRLQAQVCSGGVRLQAQVSSSGVRLQAQVSNSGVRLQAQVSSGGVRLQAQVSSSGVRR